jgi:cytochrome P460
MSRSRVLVVPGLLAVTALGLLAGAGRPQGAAPAGPRFTSDGKLVRPQGYRQWAYVSSGFGMSYNPNAGGNGAPAFTNVFVNPAAYEHFVANGRWPDKTVFVLEIYGSTSKGSINEHGSYQSELQGLDVEVKDDARFPDKWAYFGFNGGDTTAGAIAPGRNDCWQCHDQNAAVEHSFVQFYPELLQVARGKGTLKPGVHLASP